MGVSRRTKSVEELLHVFKSTDNALSVVELVKQLADKMNKTTVYRILDRLENGGQLHSFVGKDGLKWYAQCKDCSSSHHTDLHPHFQCSDCGKSECLDIDLAVPSISNRQIERADFLLIGKCEDCIV